MDLRIGQRRRLSSKELMLLNCGVGEDSWEPLDCKEIKPVNPKGNQPWEFTGKTDAEVEVPILGSPDAKSWLIGKDPDAGKGWGREEKGVTEDEMVGWHHWLNGHDLSKLWETVRDREAWNAAVHGVTKSWTRLSNWTATKYDHIFHIMIWQKKICLRKILIYLLENSITKCFKWVYSKVHLSAICPYIPTIPTSVWK